MAMDRVNEARAAVHHARRREAANGGRSADQGAVRLADPGDHRCSECSEAYHRMASAWPTPTTQDGENDAGPSQWSRNSDPLNVAVVKPWSTPLNNSGNGAWGGGEGGPNIQAQVEGLLNPDWVECLQGLPANWSHPERDTSRENPNRWPAPRGAAQHEWEPPRTTNEKHLRRKRIKALGNLCVPQQVLPLFLAIRQLEDSNA